MSFALPDPFVAVLDTLLAPPAAPRVVATDPRYQLLRQELAKLESLTGDAPDWRRVADLGTGLLQDTAKELLVAAYAALAQVKLHGLPGVHFGLLILSHLLVHPDLLPPRAVSRARALEWYLTRLRPELLSLPLAPELAPAVRALPEALRTLRTNAQTLLGDEAPNFGPLLQAAESLCLDLAEHEPAAPLPPVTSEPVPSATSIESEPVPPDTTTDDGDPLHSLRDAAAPWLAPIDPTDTCGSDPVSHETFIEIRAEVQKLHALTDTVVDWSLIEARSSELLQRHAKDLRLAAYFTLARHRSTGLRGLSLGLVVTAALLETYKETLHPRQARARRMISEWFIGQVATVVSATTEPTAADLAALRAACERLALVLTTHLGGDAPSNRPLRDALQQIATPPVTDDPIAPPPITQTPLAPTTESLPSTTPTAPQSATPTTLRPPEITTVQTAASVAAVTDLSQVDKFLDATDDALVQTARTLREAQPDDPRAYRLLRLGIWLRITSPPAVRPDGNSAIPGLADRDRAALDDMLAHQRWSDLVHRSENLLRNHRLILDLQRFTAVALTSQGHAPAALALRAELSALLLRFPTLPTLRDNAGRPLADPATQDWLSEHILPRSRPPPVATEDPEAAYFSGLSTRLRDATRDATLAEVQARIDSSPSRHLRFARGVTLAEALLLAGDLPLAALLFAGLSAEAERDGLDLWDPGLVIRCLTGAARSHHRRGHLAPRDQALQRLSRLDAVTTAALLTELP